MPYKIFLPAALIALFAFFSFRNKEKTLVKTAALKEKMLLKKQLILRCTPDWDEFSLSEEDINSVVPLPGTGKHSWAITTQNDSAQFYFNQGINLYYGFHIIEALASFKKAQQFDDNSAMLYWAEALTYGPNINDMEYSASPEALKAVEKALALSANSTALEQNLINAQNSRYSPDSTISRSSLNALYSASMKKVFEHYPGNADVIALYADALMNEHPWDYWYHDGKPKSWTPTILTVISKGLKTNSNHPGLNHYNIHMWEASLTPDKALASANRLAGITPGLSHMVHMPSHIYIRTGNFKKGTLVNEEAVKQYSQYQQLMPTVVNAAFLYEWHNLHMQAANALFLENYTYALKSANDCRNSLDTSALSLDAPVGDLVQYLWSTPYFTMVYYQQWDDIFNAQKPLAQHSYATLLWHFARGMAFTEKNNLAAAENEIEAVRNLMKEDHMKVRNGSFNTPEDATTVALNILMGLKADKENKPEEAFSYLKKAVETEDAMVYDEPKDWLIPARSYLGYTYLKHRHFNEAATVFKQSLKKDPGEPKALKGLQLAKMKQSL